MGFFSPKLSGHEGVQGKLLQIFNFYEPLLSLFSIQQAEEKIEMWTCIWEKKIVPMGAVTALYVCDKSVYPVNHRLL